MPAHTANNTSTSKENHDPHCRCGRSKASRAATSSTPRASLGDRDTNTNDSAQGAPSPEPEAARIAQLEAELEDARAQRDRANAALRAERQHAPAPPREPAAEESIPRPANASKVTMSELRKIIGVDKLTWNAIHTATRNTLSSTRLNLEHNWKAQKPAKLAMAYNAVEEKFPALRRCEGQWGIDRIAKQNWANRKRPSQPRHRARPQRIPSLDNKGEDDLMNFDGAQNQDEEEEPENGRKHVAPQDGPAYKRSRRGLTPTVCVERAQLERTLQEERAAWKTEKETTCIEHAEAERLHHDEHAARRRVLEAICLECSNLEASLDREQSAQKQEQEATRLERTEAKNLQKSLRTEIAQIVHERDLLASRLDDALCSSTLSAPTPLHGSSAAQPRRIVAKRKPNITAVKKEESPDRWSVPGWTRRSRAADRGSGDPRR
ncbi:hypothetical protein C8J57DRAFT_1227673 [Mycena rebaudengoi]|nr:hypothetical protein C8J57DRAFT_1227673 [Mycena rebaudengoi]